MFVPHLDTPLTGSFNPRPRRCRAQGRAWSIAARRDHLLPDAWASVALALGIVWQVVDASCKALGPCDGPSARMHRLRSTAFHTHSVCDATPARAIAVYR